MCIQAIPPKHNNQEDIATQVLVALRDSGDKPKSIVELVELFHKKSVAWITDPKLGIKIRYELDRFRELKFVQRKRPGGFVLTKNGMLFARVQNLS